LFLLRIFYGGRDWEGQLGALAAHDRLGRNAQVFKRPSMLAPALVLVGWSNANAGGGAIGHRLSA
jgi:hypothetical protein